MASLQMIDEFLGQKRIAVVGVSRNAKEFPNTIFRKLRDRGHTVIPINPHATTLEGEPCFASVADVPEPVDGVLIMLPGAQSAAVVQQCAAAGVPRVWLYAKAPEAAAQAEAAGMQVVHDACPHMFMGGFPHNVHRWFTKVEA